MQPVPCIHCGYNYMRRTTEPDVVRLCNSCEVRENQRNPKGENKMQTIDILIKVPQKEYIDIVLKKADGYYHEVHLYDDSEKNLEYFLSLKKKYPDVTFYANHVIFEPHSKNVRIISKKS